MIWLRLLWAFMRRRVEILGVYHKPRYYPPDGQMLKVESWHGSNVAVIADITCGGLSMLTLVPVQQREGDVVIVMRVRGRND